MKKASKSGLEDIKGLKPVKLDTVKKINRKMTNDVVPEIVTAVEKRRLAAVASRGKQLKY